VYKRGLPPLGGGEVVFKCEGIAKELKPAEMVEWGKIKRVRGVAYTARCGPMLGNRAISSARGPDSHLVTLPTFFPSSFLLNPFHFPVFVVLKSAPCILCAPGVFNKFLPDVYIHADNFKGSEAGL
jgi:hypothetical protein